MHNDQHDFEQFRGNTTMTTHALVLGGGGIAGIAWETGQLVGLAEAGRDLRNADLFVGTSAGANVSAQITSGLADEAMKAALASVGGNALDPSLRGIAADVGREQGRHEAARVAALWQYIASK
jgi:predicted acylesterase/phospholipase RssA